MAKAKKDIKKKKATKPKKVVKPKTMLDEIVDVYEDEEILKADGLDEAVIGIDPASMRLIYSMRKCVEVLSKEMTEEEAIEFLEYNTFNCYVGEKTPIWCNDLFY